MRQRIPFRRIQMEQAEALLAEPNIWLLDVRDTDAFAQDHLPGARNVSIANLQTIMDTIPKGAPVLIYCYHGHASQEYGQIFSDFGFLSVFSLDGGFEAWSSRQTKRPRVRNDQLDQWLACQGYSPATPHPGGNGTTPLMQAGHAGQIDILRLLIATGVELNTKNHDGNNALWLACAGGHLDAIDPLIEAGIDIDNQNDNGATVLMYVASSGKSAIVARLLEAGANLALESLDGFTALDMAANIECLNLLRHAARGANPRKQAVLF